MGCVDVSLSDRRRMERRRQERKHLGQIHPRSWEYTQQRYRRYGLRFLSQIPEDAAIARELGLNMERISISWPRVMPDGRGQINDKGLDFYRRAVDALLENGVKPFIMLYHWDLPQCLQEKGGWLNRGLRGVVCGICREDIRSVSHGDTVLGDDTGAADTRLPRLLGRQARTGHARLLIGLAGSAQPAARPWSCGQGVPRVGSRG